MVDCLIDENTFSVALDTGASHTVFDLNVLLIAGYEIPDALRVVQLETGMGVTDAYVFKTESLEALGLMRKGMEICAYDFLRSGVISNFEGMLGLDFFKETDLTISFKRFETILS